MIKKYLKLIIFTGLFIVIATEVILLADALNIIHIPREYTFIIKETINLNAETNSP